MLPAHVKIVMLSATAPNCIEFADWVGFVVFFILLKSKQMIFNYYLYYLSLEKGITRFIYLFRMMHKKILKAMFSSKTSFGLLAIYSLIFPCKNFF